MTHCRVAPAGRSADNADARQGTNDLHAPWGRSARSPSKLPTSILALRKKPSQRQCWVQKHPCKHYYIGSPCTLQLGTPNEHIREVDNSAYLRRASTGLLQSKTAVVPKLCRRRVVQRPTPEPIQDEENRQSKVSDEVTAPPKKRQMLIQLSSERSAGLVCGSIRFRSTKNEVS